MAEGKTRQEWADERERNIGLQVQAAKDAHDAKLRELEERIRQLEARPYPIVQPYPVPTWPVPTTPVYPYYPCPVWYSSDRTA